MKYTINPTSFNSQVINSNARKSCLLMYYEGPINDIHHMTLPTWKRNKNIDFYIVSKNSNTLKEFKNILQDADNVFFYQFDFFREVTSLFSSDRKKLFESKIIASKSPKHAICGLKPFLLTDLFSFLTKKYIYRGWIDHGVFLSRSFDPKDHFSGKGKEEIWFRHKLGQLFIVNYILDYYWVNLLEKRLKKGGCLYCFDEQEFQKNLRHPKIKSGGIVFGSVYKKSLISGTSEYIEDFKYIKEIDGDFYYKDKLIIFFEFYRQLSGVNCISLSSKTGRVTNRKVIQDPYGK